MKEQEKILDKIFVEWKEELYQLMMFVLLVCRFTLVVKKNG